MEAEIERLTQLGGERHVIGLGACVLQHIGGMAGIVVGQLMAHVAMTEVDGGGAVPVDVAVRHDNGVKVFVYDALHGEVDVPRQLGVKGQ